MNNERFIAHVFRQCVFSNVLSVCLFSQISMNSMCIHVSLVYFYALDLEWNGKTMIIRPEVSFSQEFAINNFGINSPKWPSKAVFVESTAGHSVHLYFTFLCTSWCRTKDARLRKFAGHSVQWYIMFSCVLEWVFRWYSVRNALPHSGQRWFSAHKKKWRILLWYQFQGTEMCLTYFQLNVFPSESQADTL